MSQADIQKFKTEISSDTKGFQTQLEKEINGLKGNFPTKGPHISSINQFR